MEGKNYIGGKWVKAKSGETFYSRNPSNIEDVVGAFPRSRREDVDAGVASARETYES